jgi:hypothetical protein
MTATTEKPSLPEFEGHDVAMAAVRITNAGDGLSEALSVQPKALDIGEEVFYVLRGTCSQVNHKSDKNDLLTRLHTIKASEITEIPSDAAQQMLAAAAEELQRVKDEIEGQMRLDALQAEKAAEERERRDSNMGGPA